MHRLTLRTIIYLLLDLLLAALCILHIGSILELPKPPFVAADVDGKVVITEILQQPFCPDLRVGDEVVAYNGRPVNEPTVLGFLSQRSSYDIWVDMTYRRAGEEQSATVHVMPVYGMSYVFMVSFIGLVAWCLAVFVMLMKPGELAANILHWALIALAVVVVISFDEVTQNSTLGYLSSILFFCSYAGVATTFFLFTTLFPRQKSGRLWLKVLATYAPAVVLVGLIIHHHKTAVELLSVEEFLAFRYWFNLFHIALLIYVGAGIFSFVHSYLTSTSSAERKKVKWILWGLCIGPTPFLLLTVLPRLVAPEYQIPEEHTLAFLVFIPIAFAISCIKHHALDVELVISRTTSYTIAIALLGAGYLLFVGAVASAVGNATASVGAAVIVALLFEPVRRGTMKFVDRRFFRVQYNFRQAQRTISEEIKYCLNIRQLATTVVSRVDEIIPVERIGFFVLVKPGNRIHLEAHRGFDILEGHSPTLDVMRLKTQLQLPVALDCKIEAGVQHESADVEVFQRWGIALVVSMLSEQLEILGFLVLGPKKSGTRFTGEDVDLLTAVATQGGLAIERVTLQRELVLREEEARRLVELNQLKSDFVSYVSHELKTPLTSIKMFSELLQSRQRTKNEKSLEYLQIIEGEADRLDRMVTTILDAAKIEQGVKEYQFKETDLRDVAERVMEIMKYQLQKHRFKVDFKRSRRPLTVLADPDAIAQALINLIANSIKYSLHQRYLKLSCDVQDGRVVCSVEDEGEGISPEAIPHLFERFYRDPSMSKQAQGVGLGLPLVKHIMEAHGGRVDVRSEQGKGSVFTLLFPASSSTQFSKEEQS